MLVYLLYELLYFHGMGKHPLRFGMATLAAWRGDEGPVAIKDYQVESDREYPVKVSSETEKDDPWSGTIREIGLAEAGGTPGAFWVEFETTDPYPRFYSVWRVDASGIANLSEILMATGPYTAR